MKSHRPIKRYSCAVFFLTVAAVVFLALRIVTTAYGHAVLPATYIPFEPILADIVPCVVLLFIASALAFFRTGALNALFPLYTAHRIVALAFVIVATVSQLIVLPGALNLLALVKLLAACIQAVFLLLLFIFSFTGLSSVHGLRNSFLVLNLLSHSLSYIPKLFQSISLISASTVPSHTTYYSMIMIADFANMIAGILVTVALFLIIPHVIKDRRMDASHVWQENQFEFSDAPTSLRRKDSA